MALIGICVIFFAVIGIAIALVGMSIPLLGLALMLLLIPLFLLSFVFWIWMLIDAVKNENIGGNERVAWVIAICLTHWFGALIYLFAARSRRRVLAPPRLMQA
jgi:Phospholipase_D-nuclease N-terminal